MKRLKFKLFLKSYFRRLNTGGFSVRHIPEGMEMPENRQKRVWINILLFIMTFFTTTMAQSTGGTSFREEFTSGLPFSLTLMTILSLHEFGHYFAARRFGVRATLPYFIPFPSLIGTMGAVIKTKSPIPHRRALFYIGAMGPIPGFVASLAAVVAGVYMSQVQPIIQLEPGTLITFGDSLLLKLITWSIHGTIAEGSGLVLHPVAFAGWIGFMLTSLNLMPAGQLDGGHILHALIGDRQRYAGWLTLAALVALSFFWPGWIVWVLIIMTIVMVAHPHIHETGGELSFAEKITGWSCMLILVLTFIPVPIELG